MRLRYTRHAQRQLDNIHDYIRERSPSAATRVIGRIRYCANFLLDFPLMGRPGLVPGTHELVVTRLPYIIVYRITKNDPEIVEILGIYHGAQDRSEEQFPAD
jgi:toxin ParE1/3/4